MADYRCPYGYGWCEVPCKDCPHWQGTFCELDVEAENMDELKPCPFCGGEAVVTKHHNRFTEWYLCSCKKCHISQTGSEYGFRFEAVEAWNRRADNDLALSNA